MGYMAAKKEFGTRITGRHVLGTLEIGEARRNFDLHAYYRLAKACCSCPDGEALVAQPVVSGLI